MSGAAAAWTAGVCSAGFEQAIQPPAMHITAAATTSRFMVKLRKE
jgi:hypothetical protein